MKQLASCIIEDRPLDNLAKIIQQHQKLLPDNDLYIGCNKKVEKLLYEEFPNAFFFHVPEPLHDVSYSMNNGYNRLHTRSSFWNRFLGYKNLFTFQSDSVIFRKGIEEFYRWDLVGAPWRFQDHGGNCGAALRTPEIMAKICDMFPWNSSLGNEDVYFSNILHAHPEIGKLAPRHVCLKWGVESVFSLDTFCGHAYWKHLNEDECEQINKQKFETF